LIVLVWTPSGSCPLCLTPPCYQLQKPPETAALFWASCHLVVTLLETIKSLVAGLSAAGAQ
jgi:hypothetical protein